MNIDTPKTFKRVIMLELNEISREAINRLIANGLCPNFKKLNESWIYKQTRCETEYKFLEPWIQWVTAHTGKTFAEHQIFRLGDAESELKHPQIWETLSQTAKESAIVGSMNVKRGDTKGGFFFPDPWSKAATVYPKKYQALFDLISQKVQTHATGKIKKSDIKKALLICREFKLPISLYFKIAAQLLRQKLNPKKRWQLAGLFDLFLAEIFKHILKNSEYAFYTLFLNAVAHYQHHYWRNFDKALFHSNVSAPDCEHNDDPMTFGYKIYDEIVGGLILEADKDPETLIIILSGLSQIPFTEKENEGGMNYYRLNDHHQFANTLKLNAQNILPMMSRDWQLDYEDNTTLYTDFEKLKKLTVSGEPLFSISQNTDNSLFLETAITRAVKPEERIQDETGAPLMKFQEAFTRIAVKSGHHTDIGSAWFSSKLSDLPGEPVIPLASIYSMILASLGCI